MEGNTPAEFYKNLPIFTRGIMTTIFLVTVLVSMNIMNPMLIMLNWTWVLQRLHIWRPFTCVFFLGKFSFNWIISMYFLTNFGQKLEKNEDKFKDPADYAFFLLFVTLLISMISSMLAWPDGLPFNGQSFVFAILYYWSRCEPEARLSIYGFSIPGYQFPFFMMGFTLLMGGDVWSDLVGLAAAHSYHFLRDVVPAEYGKQYIVTPNLVRLGVAKVIGQGNMPAAYRAGGGAAARAPQWFQGGGQRLGGQ